MLCYIKHFHFILYGMYSLLVSISPILTSVVGLHYYSVLFLRPFSSRCPPISSISMTTRPTCSPMGHLPGERLSLEAPGTFTPLLDLLLFDILTLIRGFLIFRLHYYQYFYRDTISRWLPTKAEEHFTCPWDMAILRWTPTRTIEGHGEIIIIIIIIIITIIIVIIIVVIIFIVFIIIIIIIIIVTLIVTVYINMKNG